MESYNAVQDMADLLEEARLERDQGVQVCVRVRSRVCLPLTHSLARSLALCVSAVSVSVGPSVGPTFLPPVDLVVLMHKNRHADIVLVVVPTSMSPRGVNVASKS